MRNVLVVEDNTLVYDTISDAFSLSGGFIVSHAVNGPLAIAALEAKRPDLALIDVGLPGYPNISGIDIAKRAVELDVPTVLMTGYADAAVKCGEYLFPVLTKPFRVGELVRRFDDVVAEAARLNRITLEQIKTGRMLIAEARTTHRTLSDEWVRICDKLMR